MKAQQGEIYSPEEEDKKLKESYLACRNIARQNSNFYYGMILTSKKKSNAILSIYAWLHAIDDIADDVSFSVEERLKKLADFRQVTNHVLNENVFNYDEELPGPYWLAFRKTILDYHIPNTYLEGMITGQVQDVVKDHYQSFAALYAHCRLVASMVGLMCIYIWGYEENSKAHAEKLAEWCGIALQLTNILRDIKEDARLKHVYLPAEFVQVAKVTPENIDDIPQEKLMHAVRKLIAKNDEYYQKSWELQKYIHKDGRLSFVVLVSLYRALFAKIRAKPELALANEKIRLTKFEKLWITLSAILKYQLTFRGKNSNGPTKI